MASAIAALARVPRVFPGATLVLAEGCADEERPENYYAAELALLLAISRHTLLPVQQWRDMLGVAGLKVAGETALATDDLTVLVCEPGRRERKATGVKAAVSPGE